MTMLQAADPVWFGASGRDRQAARIAGIVAVVLGHALVVLLLIHTVLRIDAVPRSRSVLLTVTAPEQRPEAPALRTATAPITLSPVPKPAILAPPVIGIAPEAPAEAPRICPPWPDPNTANPACPPILVLPGLFAPERLPDQNPAEIEAARKARIKELARRFGPKEAAPPGAGARDRVPITGGDAWQKMERWKDQNMSGPGVKDTIDGADPD